MNIKHAIKPIAFFVEGKPATKGSTKYLGNRRVVPDCKHLPLWNDLVRLEARKHYRGDPWPGPVVIKTQFLLKRAAYSTTVDGKPRTGFSWAHTKRPDLDKLKRAVGDALSSLVYRDDSQIVKWTGWKEYSTAGHRQGCEIEIWFPEDCEDLVRLLTGG